MSRITITSRAFAQHVVHEGSCEQQYTPSSRTLSQGTHTSDKFTPCAETQTEFSSSTTKRMYRKILWRCHTCRFNRAPLSTDLHCVNSDASRAHEWHTEFRCTNSVRRNAITHTQSGSRVWSTSSNTSFMHICDDLVLWRHRRDDLLCCRTFATGERAEQSTPYHILCRHSSRSSSNIVRHKIPECLLSHNVQTFALSLPMRCEEIIRESSPSLEPRHFPFATVNRIYKYIRTCDNSCRRTIAWAHT